MIKGILKGLVAVGLGLALVTKPASAQKPGLEFGFQFASLTMNNPDGDNNNSTVFAINPANASVAWYVNEMIAIEPTLLFNYSKPQVGDATTGIGLQVAVPIYLKKGWGKAGGFFLAPHIGTNRLSSGGNTVSQTHFGGSVGTKLKISDMLFWRVQVGVDMGSAHDIFPKYMNMGASFGLSAYLH